MKKYARLYDGKVVELFQTDGDIATMFHPDIVWVDVTDVAGIAEGWSFDGASFSQPGARPIADVKNELISAIDEKVSAIYKKYTRFSDEYVRREAAARAFVAANYAGDAGPWVMGYATPSGKTARQAADTIIAQADALSAALTVLGGLRMRKYEIVSVSSASTARTTYDDIIAAIDATAATLG